MCFFRKSANEKITTKKFKKQQSGSHSSSPALNRAPKLYNWNISQGVVKQNTWSITQVCSETKYVGIRSKVQAHVITNSSIFEWFQRTKIVVNPQDSTFYDDFLGGTLPEKFPFCFFGLRKKKSLGAAAAWECRVHTKW